MASQVNSFGRKSPNVGRTSPPAQVPTIPKYKNKTEKNETQGRTSPNKFVFTLDTTKQKTHNKTNQKHNHTHNHKYNHIKPILTMTDLDNEQFRNNSISPTPTSISTTSISPTSISPTSISPTFTHTLEIIENISKVDIVYNKYMYNAHLNLIHIIKHLVFRNSSLICGSFNSLQLNINEYSKSFMYQIKSYQEINKINFTDEQINDLFMNEIIFPKTKERLNLQTSMDILTSHTNFIKFINNIQIYFNPCEMQNYKLEFFNKGTLKDNIDNTNDLNLYNTNGNEIFLNMIKITELTYNINFEIQF